MSDYSTQYHQAIAYLAQAIYESGLLMRVCKFDLNWSDLWLSCKNRLPELQQVAYKIEDELDYELSYNQCCNAVAWVYKYNPSEWEHLVGSKCDAIKAVNKDPLVNVPVPQNPLYVWL